MGWNQPKESEGARNEGSNQTEKVQQRAVASFQQRAPFVVNPGATGDGTMDNPGIPVDTRTTADPKGVQPPSGATPLSDMRFGSGKKSQGGWPWPTGDKKHSSTDF